jgi:serine phosphatase RsbU (regulator of sigma subunit)
MKRSVILCVDDEPIVLKALETQLGRIFGKEYTIEFAETGEEALDIATEIFENNEILPLIISDQLMPGIKGNELLKKIHLLSEKTLKILLTGQADAAAVGDAVNHAKLYRYIAKPWETEDLVLTVKEALRSFTQDRKLEVQNQQLQEYNEQLEAKVAERTAEISRQNAELHLANENITASINYASRIQHAMLSSIDIIEKYFPEYFILYRPCHIVSGDFYWLKQINHFIFIVAADCTGHGVPGAFMSMLGISLLNEIVSKHDIKPPHEVLNELRLQMKESLHQTGERGEAQDGMDIAFCMFNTQNNILQFAGAYNPFYLIRNNELIEYKADRMPIGIHPKGDRAFTTMDIQLQKNDVFYIFSDGYTSQFGGEKNEKFQPKRFQELLIQINKNVMSEQKEILNFTLDHWRGDCKQIDDVCVIGVRI